MPGLLLDARQPLVRGDQLGPQLLARSVSSNGRRRGDPVTADHNGDRRVGEEVVKPRWRLGSPAGSSDDYPAVAVGQKLSRGGSRATGSRARRSQEQDRLPAYPSQHPTTRSLVGPGVQMVKSNPQSLHAIRHQTPSAAARTSISAAPAAVPARAVPRCSRLKVCGASSTSTSASIAPAAKANESGSKLSICSTKA